MAIKKQQADRTRGAGKWSVSHKIALTAGSASALYLLPGSAVAALITVNNRPVTLNFASSPGSFVTWDVNGTTVADFKLYRGNDARGGYLSLYAANVGSSRGVGLVQGGGESHALAALTASHRVGRTLNFRTFASIMRSSISNSVKSYYPAGGNLDNGLNLFGFAFVAGGTSLFGWGTINLDTTHGIVTIENWTYDDGGASVHIGTTAGTSVPEPSSLALLALGAGGLAAWRTRKRKEARPSA
jgi:hypothetical protein